MKYALETLDKLISITLDPRQWRSQEITGEWIAQQYALAKTETEHIQLVLLRRPSKPARVRALALLVGCYQSTLTRLLDRLYGYSNANRSVHPKILQLYQVIRTHLTQLLIIIEENFSKYFDVTQKIPDSYLVLCQRLFRMRAAELKKQLSSTISTPSLLEITLSSLTGNSSDREVSLVTFRDLIYRKDLIAELRSCNWPKKQHNDERLLDILLYLNYNHSGIIRHCIEQMKTELRKLKTLSDKKERLLFFQKEWQQRPVLPGVALKDGFPAVFTELLGWINAELKYLAHFEDEYSGMKLGKTTKEFEEEPEVSFVHLPVNEAGMLALVKGCIDAGLVTGQTYKGLISKIGPHVATKHKQGISAASVVKKGERITPQVKEQLKVILLEVIRHISRY